MNQLMDSKQIVFVVGALRSGTTLLHLMLGSVPGVSHLGEWDFLFEHYPGGDKAVYDTNEYIHWLMHHRIFLDKGLCIDPSLDREDLIRDFVKQKSTLGDLTVINIHRNFHLIPKLFPGAKIIHLLRDPRDVARSCVGMGWSGNSYFGVDYWMNSEESWGLLAKLLHQNEFLEISFEQLISSTDDVIAKVCAFLGLPFTADYIQYANNSTYRKPDASLIEQWKRKMSPRDVQLVEYKLGSLLEGRGYMRSEYQRLHSVSPFSLVRLAIGDWLLQYRFGMKRYGFWLFVAEKITRQLSLQLFHARLIMRKNDIDVKNLK